MAKPSRQTQMLAGIALAAAGAIALYLVTQKAAKTQKKLEDDNDDLPGKKGRHVRSDSSSTLPTDNTGSRSMSASEMDATKKKLGSSDKKSEKALHAEIEKLDKKGKAFFKNKQFLEAAEAFTEALKLIENSTDHSDTSPSNSLNKQIVTLINNRSAMYEKGGFPELALEDCKQILDVYDMSHTKARMRKLRILEQDGRFYPALIEVCAAQICYMRANRDQLRMGLPPKSQPPVSQSKVEELVTKILPEKLEEYSSENDVAKRKKVLPSDYTLLQLLKSYTGYNAWMAKAAKDGSIGNLQKEFDAIPDNDDPTTVADRASTLLKMGRRHIFDSKYENARGTLMKAFELVHENKSVQSVMKGDDYPRLLEWVGMVKHWSYDLTGAAACYEECAALEPINAEVLVKQAGAAMDGSKHDVAIKLFERALSLDPDAVDALLHRANLRMLQGKMDVAQEDLEKCVKLRPNHILARLRLAAVLTSNNDTLGAQKHLELAETTDPDSSEVQSYRGEWFFTKEEFAKAKEQFEKAIKLEPKNPTPYVNAALAVLNTPPEQGKQLEAAQDACRFLEQAIEVDPQFQSAYTQLGQLKLSMATDLENAKGVLAMYERGLSYCRTKEEMKDLFSMKLLTQAQVDAATSLKMETFSMQ